MEGNCNDWAKRFDQYNADNSPFHAKRMIEYRYSVYVFDSKSKSLIENCFIKLSGKHHCLIFLGSLIQNKKPPTNQIAEGLFLFFMSPIDSGCPCHCFRNEKFLVNFSERDHECVKNERLDQRQTDNHRSENFV
jgi:hypothetical protein